MQELAVLFGQAERLDLSLPVFGLVEAVGFSLLIAGQAVLSVWSEGRYPNVLPQIGAS